MAYRSEETPPAGRGSGARSAPPARGGYTRRIDCADTARPRSAEEAHGRGRGVPDPETWGRTHRMVH